MLLLRSHLKIPTSVMMRATTTPTPDEANVSTPSTEESNLPQTAEAESESQLAQPSGDSQDDQAAAGVENMEQSDQDIASNSEPEN